MRHIINILFILTLSSCLNHKTDKEDAVIKIETRDTFNLIKDSTKITFPKSASLTSDRYIKFIQYLDSLGIRNDTLRFKKVSSLYPNSNYKILITDGFPIYKIDIHLTAPFYNNKMLKSMALTMKDSIKKQYTIDTSKYLKAKNVWGYFFVFPKDKGSDGFIEEWEFSDSNTSKNIAEELDSKMEFAYFHRGAYIFYADNYVYVFHSRLGIWPLQEIIKIFINRNDLGITKTTKFFLEKYK